ncbi:hypothetical protein FAH66_09350 [Neisseria subflava]|nr:hypothetical protein FAH66_09350 [Neisseria subflava]
MNALNIKFQTAFLCFDGNLSSNLSTNFVYSKIIYYSDSSTLKICFILCKSISQNTAFYSIY